MSYLFEGPTLGLGNTEECEDEEEDEEDREDDENIWPTQFLLRRNSELVKNTPQKQINALELNITSSLHLTTIANQANSFSSNLFRWSGQLTVH